jgi:hypothetical protein
MRYPQARVTYAAGDAKVAVSLNRPMAGNNKLDNYVGGSFDVVSDGERTGLPWTMARAWYTLGPATASISGHVGQEQIDDLSGTPHDMNTWSINYDLILKLGRVVVTGRSFYGENLNSFFGGVFQGFMSDSTSVTNITSMGGWAQAVVKLNNQWATTVGGGIDSPDSDDFSDGMRKSNTWMFGNVAHTPSKNLKFMLELEYLKTDYIGSEAGENLRTQFVTYLTF